jgi:AcrR family transcriptional regulator
MSSMNSTTLPPQFDPARLRVTARVQEAILRYGYSALTMSVLAQACGLTRRGLYHHFSNKDDAFRAALWFENLRRLEDGTRAAREVLESGGNTLDVVAALLDVRFGVTRRMLAQSPHAKEINDVAFLIAEDMMMYVAARINEILTELLKELVVLKRLHINDGVTSEYLASLLTDGARGVNQARPPIPSEKLAQRYRDMSAAILFGCATVPG